MEGWLEFGRGPLFRLSFTLMTLGLLRLLVLTGVNFWEAYQRSPDKILPWKDLTAKTLSWLVPVTGSLWRKRPLYSTISFLFHVGLLIVPLFLAAHILLWEKGIGFDWPALPQALADALTYLTIAMGMALFAGRAFHGGSRSLSRFQDYFWPLLLVTPFATGAVCANLGVSPRLYGQLMLVHVYSANLIMALIPFTKIAHCVLLPVSQYVAGLAWKFPAGAGQRVAETLGYQDRPTWVERPRLATNKIQVPMEEA